MPEVVLVKPAHVTARNASVVPPYGVLALSAWLRRAGISCAVVDTQVEELEVGLRRLGVHADPPRVFGVSGLTWERHALARVVARLAGALPDVPVVVGGPHASSYPAEVLALPGVDVVVEREGEIVLEQLVRALREGRPLDDVPGIHWTGPDGEPRSNPRPPFLEDQDDLPFIDFGDVPLERYRRFKSFSQLGPRATLPVMTSRACPFRCTYCHLFFGKGFRPMSPERVLDEVEHQVRTTGIRDFEVLDDIFNFDRKRARAILEGLVDRGLDVTLSFPNGLRGDILPPEDVTLYRRAGTASLSLAIETATPRIQDEIKKHLRIDRIAGVIDAVARERIFSTGFFMLGFPGETRDEIDETIRFAVESPLHLALFNIVTPFQGTELGDDHPDEAARVLDANLGVEGFGFPDVDESTLQARQHAAYRRFYGSPRRIARIVRDHPVPSNLPRMGLGFLAHRVTS